MKTAMQEYLDVLQVNYNNAINKDVKEGIYIAIMIGVNQLKSLEKEKEQLEMFYCRTDKHSSVLLKMSAKLFYKKLFK